jgi:hypothetical protein
LNLVNVTVSVFHQLRTLSPKPNPLISERDRTLQARLRVAGTVILVAGLLAAILVIRAAPPEDEAALEKALNNTKRNEYEMERIAGKSNIFASEIRDWFGSLWHGRGLAKTLTFVSVTGSFACFFVAQRLNHVPKLPNPPAPRA